MKPIKTYPDWLALGTSMKDDLTAFWGGDWGCDSEVGTLKTVLLRRPGKEIEGISDPQACRWQEVMDPKLAREQHDALTEYYRSQGITVHLVESMRNDRPNAVFMRDNVLMTPEGAVLGRQAMECRRGEERYAAEALARLGVPILRSISGEGIFETACCLWVDAATVLIGTGNRANWEGVRQLEEVLEPQGVENYIYIQIPFGYAHIDSIITFVDIRTAFFDPIRMTWDVWTVLKDRGIRLIEAPDPRETQNLALNVVALSPGHVLMSSGYPQTKKAMERHGINITEINIGELRKGWGSLHCMTAVLKREAMGRPD